MSLKETLTPSMYCYWKASNKFLLIFVIERHLINWSNNIFFFLTPIVEMSMYVFPINAGCYLWVLFLFLILFIYELVSYLSTQGANIVYECLSMWLWQRRFYNLREARELNYKRRPDMFLQFNYFEVTGRFQRFPQWNIQLINPSFKWAGMRMKCIVEVCGGNLRISWN